MVLLMWLLGLLLMVEPARAARSACQKYLAEAPVERQCGPMCGLYAYKGLFEGYLRQPLSSEYAMLGIAATELEFRTKLVSDYQFKQTELKPQIGEWTGNHIWDPILSSQLYGARRSREFPDQESLDEFNVEFGRPLTAQAVFEITNDDFKLYKEGVAETDPKKRELRLRKFVDEADKLIAFAKKYSADAKASWHSDFGDFEFDIIFREDTIEANMESQLAFLRKFAADFQISNMNVRLERASKYRLQVLAFEELRIGRPIILNLGNLSQQAGHIVLAFDKRWPSRVLIRDTAHYPGIDTGIILSSPIGNMPRLKPHAAEDILALVTAKRISGR